MLFLILFSDCNNFTENYENKIVKNPSSYHLFLTQGLQMLPMIG